MRFTACDDAVSTRKTHTRKNTPSASAVGRMNDRFVLRCRSRRGGPDDDQAEQHRDERGAAELLQLRQPQRPAVADLHEVVEEADQAEAHHRHDEREPGRPASRRELGR